MWDARQYLRYGSERSRPFFDLLAQVPQTHCKQIADLGCGPGNLTRTLSERWPDAVIVGVDNSPEMLRQAVTHAVPGRLSFHEADIASWQPEQALDLLVSNAALQWVGEHARLLPRLAALLGQGGTLAVQMPNRFHDTPSQDAIEATVRAPRWQKLRSVGLHAGAVQPLRWYIETLYGLGFTVNGWETTYFHVLTGDDPVLEWLKGTALRPLLDRLDAAETPAFLQELGERLRAAYPWSGDYTLFPFPRLFFVATRRTASEKGAGNF
jgi:trans-aconitate 2-methyltransferase